MSALQPYLDVLMSECVTTPEVARAWDGDDLFGELVCCLYSGCYETFWNQTDYNNQVKSGPKREYCSKRCRGKARDEKELKDRANNRTLKQQIVNIAFGHLNRDRYIGFDGRYEGPLNKPVTLIVTIRKDKGYHPMPIDVHVKPLDVKDNSNRDILADQDWCNRQRAFPHTNPMPRAFHAFCTQCVDMVIDAKASIVRATKGVYLPVNHDCARVRVFNLMGELLEVRAL